MRDMWIIYSHSTSVPVTMFRTRFGWTIHIEHARKFHTLNVAKKVLSSESSNNGHVIGIDLHPKSRYVD